MNPKLSIPRYTDSFLVEWIKGVWKHYKENEHDFAGNYYYRQIISGAYLDQPVLVSLEHLPKELVIELEHLTDKEKNKIITSTIKDIFGELQGNGLKIQAEKEKRFHWRFT